MPYLLVYSGSYILMYSLLPYKKDIFLLPVMPYLILIIADYVKCRMVKHPKHMILLLSVIIFYEFYLYICFFLFNDNRLTPYFDILRNDANFH